MADLPWSLEIILWFMEHRVDWLTNIFLFLTFLGSELGYIFMVITIYWLYSKRLAIQLVMATLFTTIVNHTLKIIIRMPRPFVTEGTYRENWAIPESSMEETAMSFSTPSGHAQGSTTFWWYLHLKVKSRLTFILLPIMIIGISLSRPYLGVHYLEDIVLGAIIGFLLVIILHRYDDKVSNWWSDLSATLKWFVAILVPLILVLGVGILLDFSHDSETYATLGGIFSGIVAGHIIDTNSLQFDPTMEQFDGMSKVLVIIARMIIGIIIVAIFYAGLSYVFDTISGDNAFVKYILRWIRYWFVGFGGVVIAPWIYIKTKLAKQVS